MPTKEKCWCCSVDEKGRRHWYSLGPPGRDRNVPVRWERVVLCRRQWYMRARRYSNHESPPHASVAQSSGGHDRGFSHTALRRDGAVARAGFVRCWVPLHERVCRERYSRWADCATVAAILATARVLIR